MEQWRDVQAFGGKYQVSNLGRVQKAPSKVLVTFQHSAKGSYVRHVPGCLLVPFQRWPSGRLFVTLYSVDSLRYKRAYRVDALVLQAFADYNNHETIKHLDGDQKNCCLDNLVVEYELPPAPSKYRKKLDEPEVIEIYLSKKNNEQLAEQYKISPLAVRLIKQGILWEHYTQKIRRRTKKRCRAAGVEVRY